MELIVAALAIIGIAASVVRFLPRDDTGGVVLPRVVDNSIGMWLIRQATGRGQRSIADANAMAVGASTPPSPRNDAGWARTQSSESGPLRVRPTRQVVSASSRMPAPVSWTPVADLKAARARREQATERRRQAAIARRRVGIGVGAVAFGGKARLARP